MFLLFVCVPPCFVFSSEGRKEALPPIESVMATVGWRVFPDFRFVHVGRRHRNCLWCVPFICSLVGLALVTVVFLLEPRASDSKPVKIKQTSFSVFDSSWGSAIGIAASRRRRCGPASRSASTAASDFRSRIHSFSRFSRRVHLSSFVPWLGHAKPSNRRSSNFNGNREDSRNGMSSSRTGRLTWWTIGFA